MRMSSLQLGLIVAGVLLVVGVLIYNAWAERRIRRRISSAFNPQPMGNPQGVAPPQQATGNRVEPTMRGTAGDADADAQDAGRHVVGGSAHAAPPAGTAATADDEPAWSPPMDVIVHEAVVPQNAQDALDDVPGEQVMTPSVATSEPLADGPQPDRDIECIAILQPAKPLSAGALAAGLHARMGKRLRWFGRIAPGASWVQLNSATPGEFVELAACLLLADRNGAASHAQVDTFVRVVSELAPMLPAALSVPDVVAETDRAEALDRLCADVDVQVGLTILKQEPASIPGTKLRGVAEAAGFKLATGGRFEFVQEETGAVLYTMQNVRNEPFTVDTLRASATHGLVLVLDVPRVGDPLRAFDQMKLAAKRIAHTLDGELVDDNRRPLDDVALAAIRQQVQLATDALKACRIDPGSPRALALFGA
jgi:FtsZ-interacting cell division protein ZipA